MYISRIYQYILHGNACYNVLTRIRSYENLVTNNCIATHRLDVDNVGHYDVVNGGTPRTRHRCLEPLHNSKETTAP